VPGLLHFFVGGLFAAPAAILLQLQTIRRIPAVLGRGVVAFFAV
jgi:hypothetical protein